MSQWRSPKYLAFVRSHPCLACRAINEIEAHHVRFPGEAGVGQKPSDMTAVPLCNAHHRAFHQGIVSFDMVNIDPEREIRRLVNEWLARKF